MLPGNVAVLTRERAQRKMEGNRDPHTRIEGLTVQIVRIMRRQRNADTGILGSISTIRGGSACANVLRERYAKHRRTCMTSLPVGYFAQLFAMNHIP